MRTHRQIFTLLLVLLGVSRAAVAQTEWLERVDQSLSVQSRNGLFRMDLSGLLDLEGYYIDQRPPGVIFPEYDLFNPRLSLFLDTRLGPHFYSLVQARIDRGFDPGSRPNGDARFDEYLLRYTPFEDARLNIQIGKFATCVGNWVQRHDSWNNPFINAPLPYENIVIMTDHAAPGSPAAFLNRRNSPDKKSIWLATIWGPSYTSGASVFGQVNRFNYAVEVKNAGLASRPEAWDATDLGWSHPTVSGRLGYHPTPSWDWGISFSAGSYLLPEAETSLPPGKGLGDFYQYTGGYDVSYAWHHWQFWGEIYISRFEVPNVGDADTAAYYLEAKYKITSQWFGALRWNQQFFDKVSDGLGGEQPWDHDIWRIDASLGYRFDRHLQGKLQYSYSHQKGSFQQGEQLLAAQLTVKF